MTFDETIDVPTVSPMIGEGADAHRIVRVGDYAFTAWASDDEPRMRDVALAERLGFKEVRAVRKLIKRLADDGKMPGIHVRDTVSRTSMPRGGEREVKVTEYWLTEAEALYLAAKSETDAADAMLREMIRVYMLARRGLLPQAGLDRAMFTALSEIRAVQTEQQAAIARQDAAITQQAEAVTALVGVVSNLGEMVRGIFDDHTTMKRAVSGTAGSKWILGQLRKYGALMSDGTKVDIASWRSRGETELRGHLGYSGAGRAWHDLPTDDFARARVKLAEMIKSAERIAKRRQLDLAPAT